MAAILRRTCCVVHAAGSILASKLYAVGLRWCIIQRVNALK